MTITQDLLYLLLLYAVLDKDNKLSLTTGLIIAFVILLFNCFQQQCCRGNNNNNGGLLNFGNVFSNLNGTI